MLRTVHKGDRIPSWRSGECDWVAMCTLLGNDARLCCNCLVKSRT